MIDWKTDTLVQETMAFAKSIRVEPPISERDEIRQRVANFKAHQEHVAREREDFAASLRGLQIESYVHDNLDRELMLNDLAAVAGLSVHNFLRAFRKSFGTTPAQFVIDQRLRRARWLLTNTAHDIVAIALETGFSSHSHLTATMHRRHGITPRSLREAD